MFIVELTYKVPLDQVDPHLAAHIDYLKERYALNHFLASGRKVPRTGGIILSHLADKEALLAVLDQDPFKIHDLANYRITEFVPSMTSAELEFLIKKQ